MTQPLFLVAALISGAGLAVQMPPVPPPAAQDIRAELERRYAELADANAKQDMKLIMATRHESIHSIGPDGRIVGPKEMEEYSRQFHAMNQPPIISKFTIRQLSVSGDGLVAVADVFQEVTRFREIDGTRRKVDTSVVQRETWIKTPDGWKLKAVDNIRDQTRRVEGETITQGPSPADRLQGVAMRTQVLPRDVEINLALSAAPAHLRSRATVYVFGPQGYAVGRAGDQFTCLVNRDAFIDGYDALKPTCFDPEGAARIVPMILREGELIARGADAAAIRTSIEAAFERGELQPPSRPGVAYMLQGDISALNPATGAVLARSHPPHLMFYAAGLTNADFGFGGPIDGVGAPPFVYSRNKYHGYVIVALAR